MTAIIGAGLSGLIAGALNASSHIYERNNADFVSHKALLRFRDDKIARALGLTFKRVTVHKAIWLDNGSVRVTPRVANLYSQKVRGIIADSSIWNMEPAQRYIAPDNLHAILADICRERVHWNTAIESPMLMQLLEDGPIVSTIPLPILLKLLSIETPFSFTHSAIAVDRYRVPNCDVYQTIYFPDPTYCLYRATLTGELLTVESQAYSVEPELEEVVDAFGLNDIERIETTHRQTYGKIVPIDENARRSLLHRLTQEFRVYSLGRFASWRNILLDDVYDDIFAIRKMMAMHQYDQTLERIKE